MIYLVERQKSQNPVLSEKVNFSHFFAIYFERIEQFHKYGKSLKVLNNCSI